MHGAPELTLICAIYKIEDYIEDLVDSLMRGVNTPAVQVIFVDDHSPDHTVNKCRAALAKYAAQRRFGIRLVELETHGGPSFARNHVMADVTTPYVGFIDGDDAIADDYYVTLSPHLKSAHWDLIEFGHTEFSEAEKTAMTTGTLRTHSPCLCSATPATQISPYRHGFFSWSRLYKTTLVKDLRFPVGRLYEDVRYVAEAYGRTQRILRLSASLVYYRRRKDSITTVHARNRHFSDQLLNLVEGTSLALPGHTCPTGVVGMTARRALIILLKGSRIRDNNERSAFLQACEAPLRQLQQLSQQYTSMAATLYLKACRLILGFLRCWPRSLSQHGL